ncbi:hypothetical protein GW17_00048007 [Ensete ventricosum]|nr:hypothetical protein GW17_00048007 [Ensete ventricosum]
MGTWRSVVGPRTPERTSGGRVRASDAWLLHGHRHLRRDKEVRWCYREAYRGGPTVVPVTSLDHPGQGLNLISESKKGFGGDGWWSSTKSMGRKPRVIKQPLVATRGERRGA